jgi:hypothetical protein
MKEKSDMRTAIFLFYSILSFHIDWSLASTKFKVPSSKKYKAKKDIAKEARLDSLHNV